MTNSANEFFGASARCAARMVSADKITREHAADDARQLIDGLPLDIRNNKSVRGELTALETLIARTRH
jgi:hypothetical protein